MKRVLVVEDHEENFYLLQTILGAHAYDVSWARNGAEALEIAQAEPPDLLISDILMPVLDGFGLCRAWKGMPQLKQIPFIFYTATYTAPEDKEFALNLGADGFITKGTDPEEFIRKLQEQLNAISRNDLNVQTARIQDETAYYRLYNEVLIHKLEDKLLELEQANRTLQQSEAQYKYLFETNPVPMWIYDLETLRFLQVNNAAIHKYGYSREEFLSMTLRDIRPPEELPQLIENIEHHKEPFQQSGPWQHRLKDGQMISVETTSHAMEFKGHQARFVMAQDITERRRSEDALRASEAHLRKAQALANLGSWVWHIPTNHLEWSDQMYTIFDIDRNSFHGDLNEVIFQSIHPDDQEAVEEINAMVIEKKQLPPLESRIVLKDGTVRTVLAEIGEMVLDANGKPLALSGIVQDITERKKTEENLRLLSLALESAANAIVITNRDGKIKWVNPAFETLTRYSRDEVIGQNPRLLKSGMQDESFYQALWETITSGQVWRSEIVNRRKDGSLYSEEETITPMMDAQGRVTHFISVKQDISDRKQAEQQLRESEERLRLALSAAQQGIYDLNVQTGEAIVSDIYATILGYDPAGFHETLPKWIERLHPDDVGPAMQVLRDYLQGKIPEYRVEFRQRTASGDWKWVLSVGEIVERDREGRPLRMMGSHTDITESKQNALRIANLLNESQRRLQRIETLHQIDTAISSNEDLASTLNILMDQVKGQLAVDAVAVLLFDEAGEIFTYTTNLGFWSRELMNAKISQLNSPAGEVARKGELLHLDQFAGHMDAELVRQFRQEGFEEYYGVPLRAKGHLIGVLEVFHRSRIDPDEEWLSYCQTLAGQAAVAIENAQLIERLKQANEELTDAYDATIEGWSMAMDLRDRETEGHTQRVTEMTVALARKMNLPEAEIVHWRRGALLHDIGKMGVPDSILLKPGLLTEEERKIIRLHPQYAFDMLQSIDYLRPALEIPHYHHEKWDGTGYPYGLQARQIPLSARLFALIDVYDALTTDRPYRKAWTNEETLNHIADQSGKHFDPELVRVFISYLREHPSNGR